VDTSCFFWQSKNGKYSARAIFVGDAQELDLLTQNSFRRWSVLQVARDQPGLTSRLG
jgi:hypothetical protein